MTTTTAPRPAPGATVLGATGVFGVPLVLVALAVLASAGAAPTTDTHALPGGAADRAWVAAVVVALGCTATWWVDRDHPWRWPTYAGVSTGLAAALTWAAVRQSGPGGPLGVLRGAWLVVGLVAVVGAVLCGRTGGRRFGALHPAHGDDDVWLTVPLRGGGRLVVEPHRVVLRPAVFPVGSVLQAAELAEIRVLQPGTLPAAWPGSWSWWGLPSQRGLVLSPGPALRVVAGAQQWVLPVDDPAALTVVLGDRGSRSTSSRVVLHEPEWSAQHQRAARISSSYDFFNRGRVRRVQNTSRRWAWLGGVLAGLTLAYVPIGLVVSTAAVELVGPLLKLVPVVAFGLALVGYGVSIDRRVRPAEDNPLPAESGPWGEQRPDRAPVPGWQPWPPPGAARPVAGPVAGPRP